MIFANSYASVGIQPRFIQNCKAVREHGPARATFLGSPIARLNIRLQRHHLLPSTLSIARIHPE